VQPSVDDPLTREIIGAAMDVHKPLGPGLLESIYEQRSGRACKQRERSERRQVDAPIEFVGRKIMPGYPLEAPVDDRGIVELKAVEKVLLVHEDQLLTCLNLTQLSIGHIINFTTAYLRDGTVRRVLSQAPVLK